MLISLVKENYDVHDDGCTIDPGDYNLPFAPELEILRARVHSTVRTYNILLVTIFSLEKMTCNGNVRMSDLFNIYLDKNGDLVVEPVRADMPNDVKADWSSPYFLHFESKTTGIWFRAYHGLNMDLRNMIYMERLNI